MTRLWIRNPLAAFADGQDAAGGVVVENGRITECLAAGAAPASPADETFDASRHVVLPGLINTHHHFYQTLTRCCAAALDKPLFPWLQALYPIWAGLTPDALRLACRVALAELLLSGCTTAADHHYLFPKGLDDALDIAAEEAGRLGIRVTLTRGSMSLSVENGGLPPASVVQDGDLILADCEAVAARLHDAGPDSMVQIALAPCSPFSVTRSLMRETAELAQRLDLRLHTHLGETEDENAFCLDRFGCRPLDYLDEAGWLNGRTWLAHGIHFNDSEVARLGAARTGIAHCPGSNMILASGICRVPDLEAAGAPVGLGVDGSASEDASNMIQEVRHAFQIQRLANGAGCISHIDALRWATSGGAACLGRPELGTIAPGKAADLALFTLDDLRFSGHGDPLAAVVLCGAHTADRVMVAGNWVVEDGSIPGLDVASLRNDHQRAANVLQSN